MIDADSMKADLRERYAAALDRATERMTTDLITTAPHRTGELAGSIGRRPVDALAWDLYAAAEHALPVAHGSRAHDVRPVNASVLRFEIGGETIYAKVVHIPSIPANPWWDQIIDGRGGYLDDALNDLP